MGTDAKELFDFQRLDVYKQAVKVVLELDAIAADLRGRIYMRDQLRRAANSIPLNIAEGAGEFSRPEKARFYRMAKRSATECASQIVVAMKLGLCDEDRGNRVLLMLEKVFAMLIRLIRRCGEDADVPAS